ncbi:MAG TPA: hypothetical protein VKR55_11510 [Bradyrhizobium sp.]|uniref:hypothetical protein n=1 Tax=Bradyrhizobium sp. TaxID=376 RepID=UPI002B6146F9|nr:hypothetical protein [Bradyrhizobium sp.]HLZ02764.1 hypothetical protein [Bradyrhizobium sp.]
MRAGLALLVLSAMLLARPAAAYDAGDPNNCNGVDWDDKHALVVSKVVASPRVNFVKSLYDDDFKAETCPAATAACRKTSYLVTGNLVLVGKARGAFTCVSYQSPDARKQIWTTSWLPSAALTPVAPMAAPTFFDWVGTWRQPGGTIEIRRGGAGGRLKIEGEMVVPGAQDVHNGVIEAEVMPGKDAIAFLDDGSLPFETESDGGCRVRMQRIGPWLLVEDNDNCGGAGVTFTGLYHRK